MEGDCKAVKKPMGRYPNGILLGLVLLPKNSSSNKKLLVRTQVSIGTVS
jgi:hypothetical protein